jgi:hypothetical protein
MSEQERGCGYRKIGGLYLVCDPSNAIVCDGLPLPLKRCGCCGYVPLFTRNLQRIIPNYIIQAEAEVHGIRKEVWLIDRGINQDKVCSCPPTCPICYPDHQQMPSYALMYVGSEYTPTTFIQEAVHMGISKRIHEIPWWFILGETWVLLAHKHVPKGVSFEKLKTNDMLEKETVTETAVFYAFKPKRVEMPMWKEALTNDEILLLEKHGITPVLLDVTPENIKRHKNAKFNVRKLLKKLQEEEEKTKEEEEEG